MVITPAMATAALVGIRAGNLAYKIWATQTFAKMIAGDKPTLTESSYKIITDYARSLGVRGGRISDQDIIKLGFQSAITEGQGLNRKTVYTPEVIKELAEAYRVGYAKKDFSEFLSIVAHKRTEMDKRGDDDFQNAFRKVTGTERTIDNYIDKTSALGSLVNTRFLTTGKLARMIKHGDVRPVDFWTLLSSANYDESLMKGAIPYIATLRDIQSELLSSSKGLDGKEEDIVDISEKMEEFLDNIGVVVDAGSATRHGGPIQELSLKEAISGKGVPKQMLRSINVKGEVESEVDPDDVSYDKISKFFTRDSYLSNPGMRAQMLAGKQTYSVLVSSLVKSKLGLLANNNQALLIENMTGKEAERIENALYIAENDDLGSVTTRIDSYANYIDLLLHPEENPAYRENDSSGTPKYVGASVSMKKWLENEFGSGIQDYTHQKGITELARRLNSACVYQGAYAEINQREFLKSFLVASSCESLVLTPDLELECKMRDESGEEVEGNFLNNGSEPTFSTSERRLYLPLTLVTEYGVYKTSVEYTPKTKDLLENDRDGLLKIAKDLIGGSSEFKGSNPEANLRYLTTDNLLVGSNPVYAQALDKYIQTQQEENSELTLGKDSGLGARRQLGESLPLLYRDLDLYKQYKQQAANTIKGFVFTSLGSATEQRQSEHRAHQGGGSGAKKDPPITKEPQHKDLLDITRLANYKNIGELLAAVKEGEIQFYNYEKPEEGTITRPGNPELTKSEAARIPLYEKLSTHFSSRDDVIGRMNELLASGCNLRQAEEIIKYEAKEGPLAPTYEKAKTESGTYKKSVEEEIDRIQIRSLKNLLRDDSYKPVALRQEVRDFYEEQGVAPVQIEIVEKLMGAGFHADEIEDILYVNGLPLPDYNRSLQATQESEDGFNYNGFASEEAFEEYYEYQTTGTSTETGHDFSEDEDVYQFNADDQNSQTNNGFANQEAYEEFLKYQMGTQEEDLEP